MQNFNKLHSIFVLIYQNHKGTFSQKMMKKILSLKELNPETEMYKINLTNIKQTYQKV